MTTEQNKSIVRRVNKEFIEGGRIDTFNELFAEDFVNHTAPPGLAANPHGGVFFLNNLLKKAFADL